MTRTPILEVIATGSLPELSPRGRDPAQWHQAIGVARQACARIFRDGGKPTDAIRTFGLHHDIADPADWSRAVGMIADSLCTMPNRRAA